MMTRELIDGFIIDLQGSARRTEHFLLVLDDYLKALDVIEKMHKESRELQNEVDGLVRQRSEGLEEQDKKDRKANRLAAAERRKAKEEEDGTARP